MWRARKIAQATRLLSLEAVALVDQRLKSWCTDPDTQIHVRPVLDMNQQRSSESYEIPTLLQEQVILRDLTCVFPHCTRPA